MGYCASTVPRVKKKNGTATKLAVPQKTSIEISLVVSASSSLNLKKERKTEREKGGVTERGERQRQRALERKTERRVEGEGTRG